MNTFSFFDPNETDKSLLYIERNLIIKIYKSSTRDMDFRRIKSILEKIVSDYANSIVDAILDIHFICISALMNGL